MRNVLSFRLALVAALTTAGIVGAQEGGGKKSVGARGALEGEKPSEQKNAKGPNDTLGSDDDLKSPKAPSEPLTREDELKALIALTEELIAVIDTLKELTDTLKFLKENDASRIEDLPAEKLRELANDAGASRESGTPNWRRRLGQLAQDEEARRAAEANGPAAPDDDHGPFLGTTSGDLEILARIIKGETWADGPYSGMVAVGAVVMNRVRSPGFPKTIAGVAHQPWQFSCFNPGERQKLYWGPIRASALQAAREALSGKDPSGGATHYFNPYLVRPSWAKSLRFIKRIGTSPVDTHDFYGPR